MLLPASYKETSESALPTPNRILYTGPVKEELSRLTFQWSASKRKFTVQVGVTLNSKPTPLGRVLFFRKRPVNPIFPGAVRISDD
jgi:hypothetical protein